MGNWEVWEVTEDMINRGTLDTEILPLNEGDVFDLGNRTVTAYSCPGHTTYCGNLDVKSHDIAIVDGLIEAFRSLLRGDAVIGERHMQLFPERPPMKVLLWGPEVQYPHENRSGPLVCPNFNPDMLWEEGEAHIIP